MATSTHINPKVLELVGAIVISTQDAEKYLKIILPFTNSQDPSIRGVIARQEKLQKRTFGDLIGRFKDSSTSISNHLGQGLTELANQRNLIVHYFREAHGKNLHARNSQADIEMLQAQLADINKLRDMLMRLASILLEALRDTTFQGTPEYQKMHDLCAAFRQRLVG